MAIITESVLVDIVIVLLSVAGTILTFFKWKFSYWKQRGVQHPPPTIPFGNGYEVFSQKATFGHYVKKLYDEYKDKGLKYFGCYFLVTPALIVTDLDLLKSIMIKDFDHFTDRVIYVNEEVDPLSGHLFALKGLKWKNLRAKLTPTFTTEKMKMMFPTLIECSESLMKVMDEAIDGFELINIKDVVSRFTMDVIGSCAFGIECNALKNPNSEFQTYGKKIFEFNAVDKVIRFLSTVLPQVLYKLKMRIIDKKLSDFFLSIVKQTVDYREKHNITRKDFMHLLIQLKNNIKVNDEIHTGDLNNLNAKLNEKQSLTINELAAQAFIFFGAGFETSSTTLTFCFYELALNQDIQNKLREEINSVLSNHEEQITYNALADMKYMDKCIQETLRKYPVVNILFRECTKTYRIPNSDITVKKGDQILIPIYGIQNDERYYPEPEIFDPERFSAENKSKRHQLTWLPFGEGPRICIGLRFGMMQMKVALTVLLRNYIFFLNNKTAVPLETDPESIVLSPKGGVWLNAEKIIN